MAFIFRVFKSPLHLFVIAVVVTGVVLITFRLLGVEWVDTEIVLCFALIGLGFTNLRYMYLLEKRDSIEANRQGGNPD